MAEILTSDAPDPEQTLTIDQVRAMSDTERDEIRQEKMMEHIEDLAEKHTAEEDMAIASTYQMTPNSFKERMDEMFWFLRLRSTLTELDGLLEIAADLREHLKGESYIKAMACTHRWSTESINSNRPHNRDLPDIPGNLYQ